MSLPFSNSTNFRLEPCQCSRPKKCSLQRWLLVFAQLWLGSPHPQSLGNSSRYWPGNTEKHINFYGNTETFFLISMEKSLWTTVGQLLCVLESNIEQWTSNRFGQWNLHQPERNTPRSPRDQVEVHARDTAQRVPLSQRCKHWHKPTWNIVKCEDKFMKFQQVYEINWN